MTNKLFKRVLPIVLSVSLVLPTITGCGKNTTLENNVSNNISVDTEQIVEETTKAILDEIEEQPNISDIIESSESVGLSTDWEDYYGDFETFVYGLLANELKYKYDVFPAYVELQDGTLVYGIGYTDYSECYTNEDESNVVFQAGMIPYYGETIIPDEDFNNGISLYDVEYQDDTYGFVLAYESDEFKEHCVIYNKYLKYGVDSNGKVFYETSEFSREECDTEIGSLYSFDENKYLYDTEFGIYTPISGTSLSTEIDYDELEKEINEILDTQDSNFASVSVETYAYIAQESIQSYLLSMQEETFLGYDVDYLVELAEEIDPTECYRITSDGLMAVDLQNNAGNEATTLVKWLVGTGTVIATAVGMVGAVVFVECPPLSAASGAIAGTAIEIFMQVVISGKSLDSVQWNRVALAAATGAVSGFLGPYVMAQFEGATYFFVDSALDGVLGGVEKSVAAWLDGESGKQMIKQFGYGFALGFGLSAGFKGVGKALEKASSKLGPSLSKVGDKIFPKLSKKESSLATGVGSAIYKLKEVEDGSVFHSTYISKKLAWKQIDHILDEGSDELITKSFREINKNAEILDINDSVITKEALRELFDKASDGDVIGKIKIDGEVIDIIKKNGMVSVLFDSTKYQTVTLPGSFDVDRDKNMAEAAKLLKESWLEDPAKIPESIKKTLQDSNLELEDLMPEDLVEIIRKSDLVLHENVDLKTVTLVERKVHDLAKGGVFHMGGYGLAKYLKAHMGEENFDRFLSAASTEFASGG